MVIRTFGFQSTSSDHSQYRLPSSPSVAARMLTTTSKSLNSNCWGVSASRSLGPISESASIIVKTASMTSRSSFADSNEALMDYGVGFGAAGSGLATGAVDATGLAGAAAAGFFAGTGLLTTRD